MEEDNAENLREKIQRELNLFERAEYILNGGEWGLLNQDEMMLAEAGLCPFCCSVLGESRTAAVPQERQHARPENRRLLRFDEGDESCDPEVVPQESFD